MEQHFIFLSSRTTWQPAWEPGNRPIQQPAYNREIYYYFLFLPQEKKKKKRESFSLYFDIVRRLTGVMPHQMSWCYDMLTLMFNKAHLLQHLEASHIPLRLFYYYYFSLGLHILRFSRKETLEFYSWELSWHEHRVHILLSQVTSVADKSYMGL